MERSELVRLAEQIPDHEVAGTVADLRLPEVSDRPRRRLENRPSAQLVEPVLLARLPGRNEDVRIVEQCRTRELPLSLVDGSDDQGVGEIDRIGRTRHDWVVFDNTTVADRSGSEHCEHSVARSVGDHVMLVK